MNIEKKFKQYLRTRPTLPKLKITKNKLSERKIAIIVPYREDKNQDRKGQLKKFLTYMPVFLKRTNYKIYVIEQSNDGKRFNRGKLLNIGFQLAIKDGCTILITHDVDLLPNAELLPYYATYPKCPIHIANVWKDKYSYPEFIGGVFSLTPKLVQKINGFPNNFWGWGGEDDALYDRLVKVIDKLCVPAKGKLTELTHINTRKLKNKVNPQQWEDRLENLKDWKKEGMNNLTYKLIKQTCDIYLVDI
tara:strand:+ start:21011 stop:21751 length:741 start_codon:yes stop_codon:yes gene_type:complete